MKYIALDFDGTLCRNAWPEIGEPAWIHKLALWYIKRRQEKGDIIILNTLRTDPKLIDKAVSFLEGKGFKPDFVNENDPKLIKQYGKYGDARKIGADVYIDDRNIGLIGWLLRHA